MGQVAKNHDYKSELVYIYEPVETIEEIERTLLAPNCPIEPIVRAALVAIELGAHPVPISAGKRPKIKYWQRRAERPVTPEAMADAETLKQVKADLLCEFWWLHKHHNWEFHPTGWGDVMGAIACYNSTTGEEMRKLALDIDVEREDEVDQILQSEHLPGKGSDGKTPFAKIGRKGLTVPCLMAESEIRSCAYVNDAGDQIIDMLGVARQTVMPPSRYVKLDDEGQPIEQRKPILVYDAKQEVTVKDEGDVVTHYTHHEISREQRGYLSVDHWPYFEADQVDDFFSDVAFVCDGCRPKRDNGDGGPRDRTVPSLRSVHREGDEHWINDEAMRRVLDLVWTNDLGVERPWPEHPDLNLEATRYKDEIGIFQFGSVFVFEPFHRDVSSQGKSLKIVAPRETPDGKPDLKGGIIDHGDQQRWTPIQFVADRFRCLRVCAEKGLDAHSVEGKTVMVEEFKAIVKSGRTDEDLFAAYDWLCNLVWDAWKGGLREDFDALHAALLQAYETLETREIENAQAVLADDDNPDEQDVKAPLRKLNDRMGPEVYDLAPEWVKLFMDEIVKAEPNAPYSAQVGAAITFLSALSTRRFYAVTNRKELWLSVNFQLLMESGGGKDAVFRSPRRLMKAMTALRESEPDRYFGLPARSIANANGWPDDTVKRQSMLDTNTLISPPKHTPEKLTDLNTKRREIKEKLKDMAIVSDVSDDYKYTEKDLKKLEAEIDQGLYSVCPLRKLMGTAGAVTGQPALRNAWNTSAIQYVVMDESGEKMKGQMGDSTNPQNPSIGADLREGYYGHDLSPTRKAKSGVSNQHSDFFSVGFVFFGSATPKQFREMFGGDSVEKARERGDMNRWNAIEEDVIEERNEDEWAEDQVDDGLPMNTGAMNPRVVRGALDILYWGEYVTVDPFGHTRNTLEAWLFPYLDNDQFRKRIFRKPEDLPAMKKLFKEEIEPIDRHRLKQFEDDPAVRNSVVRIAEWVWRVAHLAAVAECAFADPSELEEDVPYCTIDHVRWAWAVIEPCSAFLLKETTKVTGALSKSVLKARATYAKELATALRIGKTNEISERSWADAVGRFKDIKRNNVKTEGLDERGLWMHMPLKRIGKQGWPLATQKSGGTPKDWENVKKALKDMPEIADGHAIHIGSKWDDNTLICFTDINELALQMYRGEVEHDRAALLDLATRGQIID